MIWKAKFCKISTIDIWAIGRLLWETLYLVPPGAGNDDGSSDYNHKTHNVFKHQPASWKSENKTEWDIII